MVRGGRAEAPHPRSDVSFRLDQKTANFKAAMDSRDMKWSDSTEEKQRNKPEQTMIRAGAITRIPLPPHQHCTGAKDGKLQGGLLSHTNAVECDH